MGKGSLFYHVLQSSVFLTAITEFSAASFPVCADSCGISAPTRKDTTTLWDLRELENPQGFLKVSLK